MLGGDVEQVVVSVFHWGEGEREGTEGGSTSRLICIYLDPSFPKSILIFVPRPVPVPVAEWKHSRGGGCDFFIHMYFVVLFLFSAGWMVTILHISTQERET